MTESDDEILGELTRIFRNVFQNNSITLTPDVEAEDIPEWDSMSQVTLVVEIEHVFKVRIRAADMRKVQNVAELIELIKSSMHAAAR